MASTFNFQQGRYDNSYGTSLAEMAKDFSAIGVQQGRVAQDAINQANDLAYRNARAQAQDRQNAIQTQLAYDNLGVNKEKLAIDQFNAKAKNQAAYNSLAQTGRIKEPMREDVDYSTMFDNFNKYDATRASIAASNANAAQSRMQTSVLQQQMDDAKSLNEGYISLFTPNYKDVDNPEYLNIQGEKNKLDQQIANYSKPSIVNPNTNQKWLDDAQGKITSLEELAKTRPLTQGEQGAYNSLTRTMEAVSQGEARKTYTVPQNLLDEKSKLEANLLSVPKTIKEVIPTTDATATSNIINNANLTPSAKAQLIRLVNGDSESGSINLAGSTKSSKGSSNIFGEDSLAEQKYKKSLKEDKEVNSMILNKITSANPNLPESEKETLRNLKYSGGLNKYVELNYDKDTGVLKNSPAGKQAILFKSLNSIVDKDDTDNNTTGNITQFYQSNAPTINKMSTNEINSLMELVSNNYRTQSKSSFANLSDNSPIGDSLDNAITKWNNLHPDKPLNSSDIGRHFSD